MSYLCDVFFIFILISIVINRIASFKQTSLNVSYYLWMIVWIKKENHFQIAKVKPQGVA